MKSSKTSEKIDKDKLSSAFVLAEHWKSDLEFYSDELDFLTSLINKNFMYLIEKNEYPGAQEIVNKLKQSIEVCDELLQAASTYMSNLRFSLTEEMKITEFDQEKEHIRLEAKIALFIKTFRSVKQEVFTLSKKVMEQKKMKRLIQAY